MTTSGTRGSGDVAEVVLGVATHLDFHLAVWSSTLWAEKLGRDQGAHHCQRLREAPPLGGRLRPHKVCWCGRDRQLRGLKLTRHLKEAGIPVVEVERPKRRHLRRHPPGKSDPIDAEAAARAVLAGETAGVPNSADGRVEMLRTLRSARRSAVKARVQAANLLKAMLLTAPEELRRRLRGLPTKELVAVAARFRPGGDPKDVGAATRFALRLVARRHETLSEEITELDVQLERLVIQAAPRLVSLPGVGTHHAATLFVLAWDNPERLRSEASFASLCGVSPVEASSGKVVRHRLNGVATGTPTPSTAHDLRGQDGLGATHPLLRREAHSRGEEQVGDHEMPQTVHCQGGLPRSALVGNHEATTHQHREPTLGGGPRVGLDYKSVTYITILKYRLYDIDVVINRTLVYGTLTVLLAAMYFSGVATIEAILRAFTGQEQQPQLAIVVSTLVIAALFSPLRRRIQSFIDRRFYRSKYDARKTLEAFSAKLRNDTNLDALSDDLVGVVRETMQPAHVSLWLHPDPALKDKKKRAAIRESGRDEQ